MIFVGFLVLIAIVGALFYVLVIYREVPGALEQRLGVLEALPEDLGKWKVDETSEAGKEAITKGLRREVRILYDPNAGFLGAGKLTRQVRFKNPATGQIVRIDPEEVIPRKRVRT